MKNCNILHELNLQIINGTNMIMVMEIITNIQTNIKQREIKK